MACPVDTVDTASMLRISTEAASPGRWPAPAFGTRRKLASLALVISTSIKKVLSMRWPLAATEGHTTLSDLQCDWSTRTLKLSCSFSHFFGIFLANKPAWGKR